MTAKVEERIIGTPVGKTFVRTVISDQPGPPIVLVHGGPGMTWDYLETLDALAESGGPVIYYDQLGSGLSADTPAENVTLALLLDQLSHVVESTVGEGRYVLFGHSAGCVLALEHALKGDPNLAGLVLGSGFADANDIEASIRRLCDALPNGLGQALKAGDPSSQSYQQAANEFFSRHVCRTPSPPDGLMRTLAALGENASVMRRLWGPSTFELTGQYAGWSVKHRLREIAIPTLIYRGEFDEAGPECSRPMAEAMPNAREVVVAGASHTAHIEAQEDLLAVLRQFIAKLG